MTELGSNYTITLDDDPTIHKIISQVTRCPSLPFYSGDVLLERAASYKPLAIFLDVHLPGGSNGIELIPKLRQIWDMEPIIVMSADQANELISEALTVGANDFVRKPLVPEEVRARFHTRLNDMHSLQKTEVIESGDFRFNPRKQYVEKNGRKLFLPRLETEILQLLIEHQGEVVSRNTLKKVIWDEIRVSENALDQRISNLRKIMAEVCEQPLIKTIYGVGFLYKGQPHAEQD